MSIVRLAMEEWMIPAVVAAWRERLDKFADDAKAFRKAVDRIFSSKLSRPLDARKYFFNVLVSVTQVYMDYLLISRDLPKIWALSHREPQQRRARTIFTGMREKFRERLANIECWAHFEAPPEFSELTGLKTLGDYVNTLSLHLPEIYDETCRLEANAKELMEDLNSAVLAEFEVGLKHMARHHISFVQFALEWAADEASWN